jgi:rare lipoprotein A
MDRIGKAAALLLGGLLLLGGCAGGQPAARGHFKIGQPYQVNGQWYFPRMVEQFAEVGVASWYGHPYHGRYTANGEIYNMYDMTAAHPTLPLPSVVRVTNLENGLSTVLRVNDRGPFVKDRIIDLSKQAARMLGFEKAGTAQVRVEFLGLADLYATSRAGADYAALH